MVTSIYAEKAFYRIQHPFVIKTLNKGSIGGIYLNTLTAIYEKLEEFIL